MKHLFLLVLISFVTTYSTVANTESDGADDDKPGTVKGIILDDATEVPMEYANVAIYNSTDSSLVTGGITNAKGEFKISGLTNGNYYLVAQFIGFKKSEVTNIELNNGNNVRDLGKLELSPATLNIGSVDVIADKSAIEYQLDKKVVNVSQVVNAVGGSAVDVLQNTPSIQVDIEGNVTLRGSGSFTVLIDGRPSVLSGSDALRQIPASALENIEIITNPSAKYEPDGNSGIINLVTKKNSMNGFSGLINATAGTKDKYRSDLTLNYRTEKWSFTLGANWRDETSYGGMFSNRETYIGDTTTFLMIDGDRNFTRAGQNLKGGVDYFLSNKTTLSISGEAGNSKNKRGGLGYSHEYTLPRSEDIFSLSDEISNRESDFYSTTLNFQHNFNKSGHKLEAMAFFSNQKSTDTESKTEYLTDESYTPSDTYLSRNTTNEGGDGKEFRLKADYVLPMNENSKFEAGYLGRIEKKLDDVLFQDYDTETGSWIENPMFSSVTDFKRGIHALYSTYSNKIGDFQFMGGLRGELTDRKTYSSFEDRTYTLNRIDLFPTAHFSYEIGKNNELMTSYSRRINRPNGRDLDPVPGYYNRYTIRLGNPDLKPEYTDSYEFGYMRKFGLSYLSLEAFQRVTHNKIERTETLGDDQIFYLQPFNLAKDYSTGLELMGNAEFTKWLTVNASVSAYNYRIKGELNGENIDRESTNWSGRMSTTLKFSPNSRMQIQGFYRGPSVSAQGDSKAMFFSDISYRHDLLKKKLTATISVQDPLGTGKFERSSYGENFKSSFRWEREPRVVMFTLTYKINNFKSNDRGGDSNGGGGGNLDMSGEM